MGLGATWAPAPRLRSPSQSLPLNPTSSIQPSLRHPTGMISSVTSQVEFWSSLRRPTHHVSCLALCLCSLSFSLEVTASFCVFGLFSVHPSPPSSQTFCQSCKTPPRMPIPSQGGVNFIALEPRAWSSGWMLLRAKWSWAWRFRSPPWEFLTSFYTRSLCFLDPLILLFVMYSLCVGKPGVYFPLRCRWIFATFSNTWRPGVGEHTPGPLRAGLQNPDVSLGKW